MGDEEAEEAAAGALALAEGAAGGAEAAVRWEARPEGGLQLIHKHSLAQITWHSRGDYFATVAPTANTQVPLARSAMASIKVPASSALIASGSV